MNRITKQRGPWLTGAEVRDAGVRPIVIKIDPYELQIKQKGRRAFYAVPFAAIYAFAVRAAVEQRRREKKAKSKGKVQ